MAATVHGMQVTVDRDSVCMGDDCEDHARTLEVPPDTRVGDLLPDLLSRPFLAHVAGEVSWLVELRFGRDEVVGAEWRRAPRVAVALLHVPYPGGAPTIIAMSTTDTPAAPMARMTWASKMSRPERAMATVSPEENTVRPAVATAWPMAA